MPQVLAATFKDGVFKPDEQPALAERARVRLVIQPLDCALADGDADSWAMLQQLWRDSTFDSGGDRLNRDQLHERS
jgi:predicted DNA-binding antitoxin AbrB/MazE fold protein